MIATSNLPIDAELLRLIASAPFLGILVWFIMTTVKDELKANRTETRKLRKVVIHIARRRHCNFGEQTKDHDANFDDLDLGDD